MKRFQEDRWILFVSRYDRGCKIACCGLQKIAGLSDSDAIALGAKIHASSGQPRQ